MNYQAGYKNTGHNQVALGWNAGNQNTGVNNIAIGYQTGYTNTGTDVIALGKLASFGNSGAQVTSIGYESGRANVGNNSIFFGYQAGKDNTESNQFIIKQGNVNVLPLIQGNFSSGNVGIGTTSPDAKLDVNGLIKTSGISAHYLAGTLNLNNNILTNVNKITGIDSGNYLDIYGGGVASANLILDSTEHATKGNVIIAPDGGNVGIGTTSPDFKLQVNGTIAPETTDLFDIGSSALRWLKGWFVNLDVSGNATINNLNVTGNIYNSLSHMHGLATAIQEVDTVDTWYNVTFNSSLGDISGDITFVDNRTLIIGSDGHYTINFGCGVEDSSPSPNAHVGMRIANNGVEVVGSYVEYDTTKQNSDFWLEHLTHVELNAGDELNMQYIASDTDVTMSQEDTYATQGFSCYGYLQEVMN